MSDSKLTSIEGSINRETAGAITVAKGGGAVSFEKIGEMMDFAKLMAVSGQAVPSYLRANAGACLAITVQANEWGFSPFAVARMSYVVGDTIGYQGQLIHAVIEKRAPLRNRLKFEYKGDGADLQCIVSGHLIKEVDPLVYESPLFKDINPKNSPLWKTDPKQQISYYSARAWARRYCPDVLLGAYSEDELRDFNIGAEHAKDVTSELREEPIHHRLSASAATKAGFQADAIARTIAEVSGRKPVEQNPAGPSVPPTDPAGDAPTLSSPGEAVGASDESSPSAGEVGAAVEGSSGVEVADGVGTAAPQNPTVSVPKDGLQYRAWAEHKLAECEKTGEAIAWWRSSFEKKLRNSLPNITQELVNECMALVTARDVELSKGGAK